MASKIRKVITRFHLEDLGRAVVINSRLQKRKLRGTDKRIISAYFKNNQIRKLQIGSGGNILDGWLNSDYCPKTSETIHLDATKIFPFEQNSFDYVFAEHVIEHISYDEGAFMLSEIHRILKPHGIVRISTPDLMFLINIYKENKSELQKRYLKWASQGISDVPIGLEDAFVINNFVRAWGHQFIYDEKILKHSLQKSGFVSIKKSELMQSEDKNLKNLENISRAPEGFIQLESICFEASKP